MAAPLLLAAPVAADEATPPDAAQRLLKGYLHKTSNSLCGIKGYASLIAEADEPRQPAAGWARKIIHEVERMEAIFRSVGDLTAPRGNPDLGVNLPRLLGDVFRVCAERCPGLAIDVGELLHGQILLPKADLCLVVTELLCNAWEGADGRGNPVRVTATVARRSEDRLWLVLADDGPGIAPALLPQVRDPFVTTKDGHVGVGLTRVETLLDMYRLGWELRSAPGRGTTAIVEMAEALD